MLIQAGLMVGRLARVLGVACEGEGLGATERGRSSDLGLPVGVNLQYDTLVRNLVLRTWQRNPERLFTYTLKSGLSGVLGLLAASLGALALGSTWIQSDASAIALSAVKELAKSAAAIMHHRLSLRVAEVGNRRRPAWARTGAPSPSGRKRAQLHCFESVRLIMGNRNSRCRTCLGGSHLEFSAKDECVVEFGVDCRLGVDYESSKF